MDYENILTSHGEQFMSMFDSSSDEEDSSSSQKPVAAAQKSAASTTKKSTAAASSRKRGRDEINEKQQSNSQKQSKTKQKSDFIDELFVGVKDQSKAAASSSSDQNDADQPRKKKPKVIVFDDSKFMAQPAESIDHHSLDGNEDEFAIGIRAQRELRQKKHLERQKEQQETKILMRKIRLGDDFDVTKNETLKRKSDDQLERDKLMSELQDFVYKNTASKQEYERFQEEQKRLQGKQFKKTKNEGKNYKELKEELKVKKELERAQLQEAKAMGTVDLKQLRKKKYADDHKAKLKEIRMLERWGAPQDEGRADKKLVKARKIGSGSLGTWKKGSLVLSKRDLKHMGISNPQL